jgi:hypothetical protein
VFLKKIVVQLTNGINLVVILMVHPLGIMPVIQFLYRVMGRELLLVPLGPRVNREKHLFTILFLVQTHGAKELL